MGAGNRLAEDMVGTRQSKTTESERGCKVTGQHEQRQAAAATANPLSLCLDE